LTQDGIRQQSANVVTREDVDAVDNVLIETISQWRDQAHVVIDSHPVTKESFGFRVTPFSLYQLVRVSPTLIINLYADPEVVLQRIQTNAQGRPLVSAYEAGYHNGLQGAVAVVYGIQMGIPIYMLDSARPTAELVEHVQKRLAR
jgi:adenylate kinase